MQRGVYLDGWHPRPHDYHPSLVASTSRRNPD